MTARAEPRQRSARPTRPARGERGAVLITVLVLVAVMGVVAATILDDVRFGVRRALNMRLADQARWYLLATEDLARAAIGASWRAEPAISTLRSTWATAPQRFPVDGGFLEGEIRDGGNCFNLNSLVDGVPGRRLEANDAAIEEYRRLLRLLGLPAGEAGALANAAVDWLDSDATPRDGGAEDIHYARRDPPGRAANTLMAEASELRGVIGYSRALYRTLRPFVCALDSTAPSVLNINTLRVDQAPLLAALVGEGLALDRAADLIAARPAAGYRRAEQLWAERAFGEVALDAATRARVDVQTWVYALSSRVIVHDAYAEGSALFRLRPSGRIELLARRYGEDE